MHLEREKEKRKKDQDEIDTLKLNDDIETKLQYNIQGEIYCVHL